MQKRPEQQFRALDFLFSGPSGALCGIYQHNALGSQLVTDAVSLGKVLGLLGIGAGADQSLYLCILLAGLADHGETGSGGGKKCFF